MLDRFDQLLRKRIAESDIPFLGLHGGPFSDEIRRSIAGAVNENPTLRAYLNNLARWPALFSIYLTMHVMRGFGESGYFEVYPYIEEALGRVTLNLREREVLWASFRHACIQLGLEVSSRKAGMHYMVDEYLRQAGVPLAYVLDLTDRMLRLESQAGIPEDDDTDGIRLWQDELLDRLDPPFPQTARNALQLDQGGYYVRLFIRLLSGESHLHEGQSDVERRMLMAIQATGQGGRQARRSIAIPRVVLRDYQIGVQLPGGEGRGWVVDIDGVRRTFQPERETRFVLAHAPLPRRIFIQDSAGSIQRNQTLWPGTENNRFLIFSRMTGAFKGASRLGEEFSLEPGDYNLLLRFQPDDFPGAVECITEDPCVYSIEISLNPAERCELLRGPAVATLQAYAQPLLKWTGSFVTANEGRELFFSTGLCLEILIPEDLIAGQHSDYVLRVSPGSLGTNYEYPVKVDNSGQDTVDFKFLAKELDWKPGLGRFLVELRRRGETRVIARSSTFVWNGLECVKQRVRFQCATLPTNLDPRLSNNVNVIPDSRIVTYHDENQRFFVMVFRLTEGRYVSFTWNLPGIFLYLDDGTLLERAIRKGSTLVAGSLSRQQLRIYGNEKGRLRLGALDRLVDFSRVGSIRLSLSGLADYLTPSSTTLEFIPDGGTGLDVQLVSLVHPHEALKFAIKQSSDQVVLEFQLGQEVEKFRLLAQDMLSGQVFEVELVPNSPEQPGGELGNLRAFHSPIEDGTHDLSVYLPTEKWPRGAWIVNLEAKINHNWGPLCNARQDHCAAGFLLGGPRETAHIQILAEDLRMVNEESLVSALARGHQALLTCYAKESWSSLAWIPEFWMFLSERFAEPNRKYLAGLMRLASRRPEETSSPSWIPLTSLWVRLPWLLSLPRHKYHSLSYQHGKVAEALAITSEFGDAPQEICKRDLDVVPLMAFSNAMEIDSQNACPSGFALAKYRQALGECDLYEKRYLLFRDDWHPGKGDYLGALHYRYAWKAFQSIYTQSLEGNNRRRGNALRMSTWARRHLRELDSHGLPSHLRQGSLGLGSLDEIPNEEPDEVAQQRENLVNMERLISLFAQVCRWEARVPGVVSKFMQWLPDDSQTCELVLGYLLFIGEELLAYYLMLWELALTADHDLRGS